MGNKRIFLGYTGNNLYMTSNGLHFIDTPYFKILVKDLKIESEEEVENAFNEAMVKISDNVRKNRPIEFLVADDFDRYFSHVKTIISNYFSKAVVSHYKRP